MSRLQLLTQQIVAQAAENDRLRRENAVLEQELAASRTTQ
jgi:cell division protein FtsB